MTDPPARSRAFRIACWLVLWIAFVRAPEPAANTLVDPSWGAVQAFVLLGGARSGVDTVFTHGPLGWFANPTYVPDLLGVHWVFELAFKLACAGLVSSAIARIEGTLDRTLCLAAAVLAGVGAHGLAFVVLLANAAWIARSPDRPLIATWIGFIPSCVLAATKFPYFLAAGASTIVLLHLVARGSWWRGASFAGGCALLFCLCWRACGQAIADIPAWISSSLAIARGYGAAMGHAVPPLLSSTASLVLASGVLTLVLARRSDRGRVSAAWILLWSAFAWLSFKNGLVRGHARSLVWFDFAMIAGFIGPSLEHGLTKAARASRRLTWLLALAGHVLALPGSGGVPVASLVEHASRVRRNLEYVVLPQAVRLRREADLAAKRRELGLPLVRARVGSDPVDVFGNMQGIAFLNDLNFSPRPVFQGYAAFDPDLQERNRAFYASERAPRWVLFSPSQIDWHFPTIEDAAAFQVLSRDYRLDVEEQGWVLLERRETGARPRVESAVTASRAVALCEWIELADPLVTGIPDRRPATLRLDVRPTLFGRACAAVWKLPLLELEVEDDLGQVERWRIAPGYVESPFLVQPLLTTSERMRGWWSGAFERWARRVRVLVADSDRWAFEEPVGVEIADASAWAPPQDPGYGRARLERVLNPLPAEIDTPRGHEIRRLRDANDVLVVGTPSRIRFALPAGRWTVTAWCGLHPRLAAADARGSASFRIATRTPAAGETDVTHADVTPVPWPTVTRLVASFELAEGGSLLLSAIRADEQSAEFPGAFWTNVNVERAP